MRRATSAAACALLLSLSAYAHHSTLGVYDVNRTVEIEGVVTGVLWRNPHPRYTVAVVDEAGETVEWQVETGAISTLRLRGLDPDFIQVGDTVRLAGEGSTRGRPELFARNLLLGNGLEVLLSASSTPRWFSASPERLFSPTVDEELAAEGRRNARGIYRTWTSVFGDRDSFPIFGAADYPMTERGRELKGEWNPRESPYLECGRKGMPYLMVTPYPLEFIEDGDDIEIHFEEFGERRTIHMNSDGPPDNEPFTRLGYSSGRWDGDTLIVETERIEASHFYGDGTPTSRAMHVTERFTLADDESRLDYHLTVDDPEMFTEVMEFTRYWAWRPEIHVRPFGCEQ